MSSCQVRPEEFLHISENVISAGKGKADPTILAPQVFSIFAVVPWYV